MESNPGEQTAKKWKFLLLIGRPLAIVGILVFLLGLPEGLSGTQLGTSFWNAFNSGGVVLFVTGFACAWTGKIGAYWFHG